MICKYKLGYYNYHWSLFDAEKLIFSGESSSKDYMKSDASYWAEELGYDGDLVFEHCDNFKHRSD